jgi:hypothetical protein
MPCGLSGGISAHRTVPRVLTAALLFVGLATGAFAAGSDTLQWSGFALIRPQTAASGAPLDDNALSAQLQLGLDWRPSVAFGSHLHLLARNDEDGSHRGRIGIVEAYLEQNAHIGRGRLHLMEGAFFLPTSRENVDSLWESPYTISSSALNSWMGEELRPIGLDAFYRQPLGAAGAVTGGVTAFAGNDTFGALPIDRGWDLSDRWTLLGEHVPVNARFFTSVSAENDHHLGWAARAKWNNDSATLQVTHLDNRSDALRYGELYDWETPFTIVGGDYTWRDWTALAETGWGTTTIATSRGRFTSDIRASYLLLSRRIGKFRASVRGDEYLRGQEHGHALTAALFWEGVPRLRGGIEGIVADGEKRLALELRYRF